MELDQTSRQAAYERRELSRFGPNDAHDFVAPSAFASVPFEPRIHGHRVYCECPQCCYQRKHPQIPAPPERKLKGGLE